VRGDNLCLWSIRGLTSQECLIEERSECWPIRSSGAISVDLLREQLKQTIVALFPNGPKLTLHVVTRSTLPVTL
jgi:hypothetical protein